MSQIGSHSDSRSRSKDLVRAGVDDEAQPSEGRLSLGAQGFCRVGA